MNIKQALKRVAVAAGRCVFLLEYYFCRLLPKRDIITFMSRQSDEPSLDFRLLRTHIVCNYPDMRVVILAKKVGNPIRYIFHMIVQTYYLAVSRAVVLDSFCIVLGLLYKHVDTPVLQMWHALGLMKKAGYALLDKGEESRSASDAELFGMHKGYTSVLMSSANLAEEFSQTFNVDKDVLFEAPLPRVDALLSEYYRQERRYEIYDAFPQLVGKRVIVYAPTFRRVPALNEADAMRALVDQIDFNTTVLIYQRHPVSAQRIDDERVLQDYDCRYNMLFVADAVITDYSTVIYEAGLLDIPVYLYAYDQEEYLAKRELHLDLARDIPTVFTSDAKELMAAVYAGNFDHAAFCSFIRRYIAVPVGQSCAARIAEHLFSLIQR